MVRGRGGDQAAAVQRALVLLRFLAQRGDIGASVGDVREHVADYATADQDVIARDIRSIRSAGWRITNTAPVGATAHYRLFPRDHRIAVSLTQEERDALSRLAQTMNIPTAAIGVDAPSVDVGFGERAAVEVDLRLRRDDQADATMGVLNDAIEHRREVRFTHLGRTRRIHPYALRRGEGCWWVDGLDVDADGPRSFPVARVHDPHPGASGAYERPSWTSPPTNDPLTWRREPPDRVTLEVEPDFAPDARAAFAPVIVGDTRADAAEGSAVRLEVEVTHRAAFRTALYHLGGSARVVAPAAAVEAERDWLEHVVTGD